MANIIYNISTTSELSSTQEDTYTDISKIGIIGNNRKLQVNKSVDVDAVINSIENIFSFIPGERILDPKFGNQLYKYLYEGITDKNREQVMSEVKRCVMQFDSRVQIVDVVDITQDLDMDDNMVHIEIVYKITDLDDQLYTQSYSTQKTVT